MRKCRECSKEVKKEDTLPYIDAFAYHPNCFLIHLEEMIRYNKEEEEERRHQIEMYEHQLEILKKDHPELILEKI